MGNNKKVSLFGQKVKQSVIEAVTATATIAEEAYPTGTFNKKEPEKPGGRVSYVAETETRTVLKFQTSSGADARGKGSFTVPLEDCDGALSTLQGVDINALNVETEEEWLDVPAAINRTIRRFTDDDGDEFVGFRTRLGKGSKEIRIPIEEWNTFVSESLPMLVGAANGKLKELSEKKASKKREKKDS